MLFINIIFLSAFFIEAISTFVSVAGLTSFLGSSLVIIAMSVSLDIAKITTVSFLYTYWKDINPAMKIYMTVAALILMVITSIGVFGYLSAAFQTAILPAKGSDIELTALTKESHKLEARKLEIDAQIAKLPDNFVNGRTRLMDGFKEETNTINRRLSEIDHKLPELQIKNANVQAHAGPILYVASAFDIPVEEAIKYIILSIIFVFDPLAILLIISGNFLIDKRKKDKASGHHDEKIHHLSIVPEPPKKKTRNKKPEVVSAPVDTAPKAEPIQAIEPIPVVVPIQPPAAEPVVALEEASKVETTEKDPQINLADQIIDFGDNEPKTEPSVLDEPSIDSLSEAELDALLRDTISEQAPAVLKIDDEVVTEPVVPSSSILDNVTPAMIEKADVKFRLDEKSDWKPSNEHQHFSKL